MKHDLFLEESVKCIYCTSKKIKVAQLRNNKSGQKPVYECKKCCRRFTLNDGFLKFRHPPTVIRTALRLHKNGHSLSQVTFQLKNNFGIIISRKTVLDWEKRFLTGENGVEL